MTRDNVSFMESHLFDQFFIWIIFIDAKVNYLKQNQLNRPALYCAKFFNYTAEATSTDQRSDFRLAHLREKKFRSCKHGHRSAVDLFGHVESLNMLLVCIAYSV